MWQFKGFIMELHLLGSLSATAQSRVTSFCICPDGWMTLAGEAEVSIRHSHSKGDTHAAWRGSAGRSR